MGEIDTRVQHGDDYVSRTGPQVPGLFHPNAAQIPLVGLVERVIGRDLTVLFAFDLGGAHRALCLECAQDALGIVRGQPNAIDRERFELLQDTSADGRDRPLASSRVDRVAQCYERYRLSRGRPNSVRTGDQTGRERESDKYENRATSHHGKTRAA